MLLNPKPNFFFKKLKIKNFFKKSVTQTEVLKINSSNTIWFKDLVIWFMLGNDGREIFEYLFSVIKPLHLYKSRKLCMCCKNSWGHNRHWACIWVMVFCAAFTVIALCNRILSAKCTCYMFRPMAVVVTWCNTGKNTRNTVDSYCVWVKFCSLLLKKNLLMPNCSQFLHPLQMKSQFSFLAPSSSISLCPCTSPPCLMQNKYHI